MAATINVVKESTETRVVGAATRVCPSRSTSRDTCGDRKGLLQAVIAEIDGEMAARVNEVASRAPTRWQHFVDECTTYIEMALEPEIQRIMLRDGPAVLGDPAQWPNANACIASMTDHLTRLQQEGVVVPDLDPETAARLINGASSQASQRIANSNDPEATSKKAIAAFKQLLEGLRNRADRSIG